MPKPPNTSCGMQAECTLYIVLKTGSLCLLTSVVHLVKSTGSRCTVVSAHTHCDHKCEGMRAVNVSSGVGTRYCWPSVTQWYISLTIVSQVTEVYILSRSTIVSQ